MEPMEQERPLPGGPRQPEPEDWYCSACGRLEPAPARFCGRCGKPLAPGAPPRVPLPPPAEHRRRHRRWPVKRYSMLMLLAAAIGTTIYVLASGRLQEFRRLALRGRGASVTHTEARVDEVVWKVMTGQDGVLISATGRDVPLARDQLLISEAVQAEGSRDGAGLRQMTAAGKVVMAPPRTRVTVLDTAYLNTVAVSKVRVLNGAAEGKQGWVLASQVDR